MKNNFLETVFFLTLLIISSFSATTTLADDWDKYRPPHAHKNKNECVYHLKNVSRQYWYIKFYSPSDSSDPGGDYDYIQIDPGATVHITNGGNSVRRRDINSQTKTYWANHPRFRLQRTTGPRKSGKATFNKSGEWVDDSRYQKCVAGRINVRGVTCAPDQRGNLTLDMGCKQILSDAKLVPLGHDHGGNRRWFISQCKGAIESIIDREWFGQQDRHFLLHGAGSGKSCWYDF